MGNFSKIPHLLACFCELHQIASLCIHLLSLMFVQRLQLEFMINNGSICNNIRVKYTIST